MPASVHFYRDKLGFEIVSSSPVPGEDKFHWCLMRLEGTELMLNNAYEFDEERRVPPDAARVAAHGDTCIYFGCPDIDSAYSELQAKGVSVREPKVAPYGMKQIHLHDPDGYHLRFQWES